jgi:hypothetical protein
VTDTEKQIRQSIMDMWATKLRNFDLVIDPSGVGRFVKKERK